jgi:hypothetical protein
MRRIDGIVNLFGQENKKLKKSDTQMLKHRAIDKKIVKVNLDI